MPKMSSSDLVQAQLCGWMSDIIQKSKVVDVSCDVGVGLRAVYAGDVFLFADVRSHVVRLVSVRRSLVKIL
jgi:hypothetical protein